MGKLYVVGTPIGNMEDVTLRALRVLGEVGLVAAEDTRVTRRLLSRHGVRARVVSVVGGGYGAGVRRVLGGLAEGDVALVSDAGMPGVNDPGQGLVRAVCDAGYEVVVVPGASAVTAAVSVSGLVSEGFVYLGYLPRKRGERVGLLGSLVGERRALVALESPQRLVGSLVDVGEVMGGGRRVAVCREMTKMYEEVFRGSVREAVEYFGDVRGEVTLVIEGGVGDGGGADAEVEAEAARALEGLRMEGVGIRDAVAEVSGVMGLSKRRVYGLWLAGGDGG